MQEETMKQFSELQIDGIRHRVKSTIDYLESEDITRHDIDYQLRSVEIGIKLVLADVVEILPSPLYEDVKRILDRRERLWRKRYFSDQPEMQEEGKPDETIS
jgi:hypothetical protein